MAREGTPAPPNTDPSPHPHTIRTSNFKLQRLLLLPAAQKPMPMSMPLFLPLFFDHTYTVEAVLVPRSTIHGRARFHWALLPTIPRRCPCLSRLPVRALTATPCHYHAVVLGSNTVRFWHCSPLEVEMLHHEIFVNQVYLRNGVTLVTPPPISQSPNLLLKYHHHHPPQITPPPPPPSARCQRLAPSSAL